MLVLSRQRDEIIAIGDGIEVRVVDIRGDRVRLGITAPRQVVINRLDAAGVVQPHDHGRQKPPRVPPAPPGPAVGRIAAGGASIAQPLDIGAGAGHGHPGAPAQTGPRVDAG